MTTAPEAPAVAVPVWESGHCVSCGKSRPATLPVGEVRLCATCTWQIAQVQLNREAIAAGQAAVVPAPAVWGASIASDPAVWGLVEDVPEVPYVPHARLSCEGCVPEPRGWVARLAGMWLCPTCVTVARGRWMSRRRRG